MRNFNTQFNRQLRFYGALVTTLLMILLNGSMMWMTSVQYDAQLHRQEESVVTMVEHLLTQTTLEDAVVYLEHYSHTHGVRLRLLSPTQESWFESEFAPEGDTPVAVLNAQGTLLAYLIIDQQAAFITQDYLVSIAVINGISFLILVMAVWFLGWIGHRHYQTLAHDMAQIGQEHATFIYADIALIHERYRQALQALQHYQRDRTHIIQTLAHDLKTPLTVMQMTLEGLQQHRLAWSDTHYQSLLEEIHLMNEIVPQLIAHEPSEVVVTVDLKHLIEEQVQQLSPLFQAKSIHLQLSLESTVLTVDRVGFQRVLQHLLTNSVYYSKPHRRLSITLQASTRTLTLSDQGIGMSEHTLAQLARGPFREINSTKYNAQGSGLGLQIVKQWAETYHIRFDIQSQPGQGTTITLQWTI